MQSIRAALGHEADCFNEADAIKVGKSQVPIFCPRQSRSFNEADAIKVGKSATRAKHYERKAASMRPTQLRSENALRALHATLKMSGFNEADAIKVGKFPSGGKRANSKARLQ